MSEKYIKKLEESNRILQTRNMNYEKFKDLLYVLLNKCLKDERGNKHWGNPDLGYGDFLAAVEEDFERFRIISDNARVQATLNHHENSLDKTEDELIFNFIKKLENE